tara:strand:- start:1714 stop:2031 length:318 start_codon:yes stop_codon:yes gene_type:complete
LKIPKTRKTFCPKCKTQTEHTITIAKKRDRGTLKAGSLARLGARGRGKSGFGNHGSKSRKAISAFKRTGAKTSHKSDLRFKCSVCKKTQVKSSIRSKKLVIEAQT